MGVIGNLVEKAGSQSALEDGKTKMNTRKSSIPEFVETFRLATTYLLLCIFY